MATHAPPTGTMSSGRTGIAPTRVLIVDDHALIRRGLTEILDLEDDLTVVAQAGSVLEALAKYDELEPDVVIADLQLQDGTGLDIVRAIRKVSNTAGLVVLTMHSGDEQLLAAMQVGASGFVGKDAPSRELARAVRYAVTSPRSFVCTGLAGAMYERSHGESTRLTDREHDVLVLLAEGLGVAALASELYLSESTVKSHVARLYQKLGASNRAQALVTAMRIGLLSNLRPMTVPEETAPRSPGPRPAAVRARDHSSTTARVTACTVAGSLTERRGLGSSPRHQAAAGAPDLQGPARRPRRPSVLVCPATPPSAPTA